MVNGEMKFILLLAIGLAGDAENVPVSDPEPVEEPEPPEEVEECEEGVKSLLKGAEGLEWFLLDRKYYKEVCPELKWEQPGIEEYKKDPRSYLPEECKRDKK